MSYFSWLQNRCDEETKKKKKYVASKSRGQWRMTSNETNCLSAVWRQPVRQTLLAFGLRAHVYNRQYSVCQIYVNWPFFVAGCDAKCISIAPSDSKIAHEAVHSLSYSLPRSSFLVFFSPNSKYFTAFHFVPEMQKKCILKLIRLRFDNCFSL